jgi:hypothetical protein
MRVEEYGVTAAMALVETPPDAEDLSWPSPAIEAIWRDSAPAALRESFAAGDFAGGWKAWKRHLVRRRRPIALLRLVKEPRGVFDWGRIAAAESPREARLMKLLARRRAKRGSDRESLAAVAREWLGEHEFDGDRSKLANAEKNALHNGFNGVGHNGLSHNGAGHNGAAPGANGAPELPRLPELESQAAAGFESLAWLHVLAARVDLFEGDLWWRVWRQLYQGALEPSPALESDPLGHQLAAGELPLTLAYLFPELEGGEELQRSGSAALSHGMAELVDGEGLPQCRHLAVFPALVACWTRCRLLGEYLEGGCWTAETETQFPLAVREVVRLRRQDGSPVFARPPELAHANGESIAVDRNLRRSNEWLAVAADLVTDKPTRRLIRAAGRDWRKKSDRNGRSCQLPAPAVHSEWAKIAVLRADWTPQAERMTVAYGDRAVRLEVAVGADLLLSGRWDLELQADCAPIEPAGSWREICWVSDQDCDYLELEMAMTGGLRVQRQLLLARKDQFLLLADAVLGDRPQELLYRGRLPLSSRLTASAAADTREVLLEARKARALILPLALPEWRAEPRGGSLDVSGGALELRQSVFGRRLFAPLWIDLAPRRAHEAVTWRQLTIAEQRQNQPRDVAVGYRVQFGRRQWVIYRSLTRPANRTLLGQNLSTEFFLGRFKRDGESKTILEIE